MTDSDGNPTLGRKKGSAATHICFICPYIGGYLTPGSSTHVGGAERQQHLLATELREAGYDVSFLTFEADTGGNASKPEWIDGFRVWKTLPRTNSLTQTPKVLSRLLRSVRRIDADLFYVRGNPPLCILSSYGCRLLGKRLVYCVANDSNLELARLSDHHGMFTYTLPKLAYIDAISRTDAVIAQTEYQQRLLGSVFDIDSTVIPNAYSLAADHEQEPMADRSHVLWVGSLDAEQKKPDRFLRLAEQLPDTEFVLIGWSDDKAYREMIRDRAADLPNCQFEGFVPPDEIDRYYRTAVCLVNTSEYEGFPNTFLEAWRFGAPVVSLHHTLDGVLVDKNVGLHAGSMDRLTEQVSMLWDQPEQAAELGDAGRAHLQQHYSLETVSETYMTLFDEIVARK